jgi:glycogen operon protein
MQVNYELTPGKLHPLGATVIASNSRDEISINFAVFSSSAKKVLLCLFDDSGDNELFQFELFKGEGHIWHGQIIGLTVGQLYGYRVSGEFNPRAGLRFNPNNLLIDPYAKALFGEFKSSSAFDFILNSGEEPHENPDQNTVTEEINNLDTAAFMPKSKVVDLQPYQGVKPNIPWHDTVIYECHVKGATINNTLITDSLRGKFLGLAEPAFIAHLKNLGITTLELLPVHQFISERFLQDKNLTNYWGYNTLNFFTPHNAYLSQGQIIEFQTMVSELHKHNIEVILDVVFNHTAEGNNQGPTLCFKGYDNASYYRLDPINPSMYINDTGCGNTLNISHPRTLQLVLDSLRYWVEIMGVDGFRFDLAPILGRDRSGFKTHHAFFQAINQDPVLSQVKLIAEPWDIGPGGYQLGNFPANWREWNDKYRDVVRKFWRTDLGLLPEFALRFHGSNDLFEHNGKNSSASINFISAHDGFTLTDLVSFNDKHNGDNAEENRDGHSENYSFNFGVEGITAETDIVAKRLKQQKNILLTLIFSQGVPMLCAGTESEHSQNGNNNAYCQDNTISWLADQNVYQKSPLYRFINQAISLRKQFEVFQQTRFIHQDDNEFELFWLNKNCEPMAELDWQQADNHILGYMLSGKSEQNSDQVLLIIFNASNNDFTFQLPTIHSVNRWQVRLNTLPSPNLNEFYSAQQSLVIGAQTAWVLSANKEGILSE